MKDIHYDINVPRNKEIIKFDLLHMNTVKNIMHVNLK